MITKPNFFIVGAPKCGTTALSEYLRCHPNIFLSDPKEPHFFADDFPRHRFVETLEEYLRLFKNTTPRHIAIGEASVWYLYSSVAISKIYEFNKNARIIIMLRNPVDLIYSLHSDNLYNYNEDVRDFEAALRLEGVRKMGKNIPKTCRQPMMLQYTQIGMLSEYVNNVLDVFPLEQVKIVLFDDFIQSTRSVYEDILTFLEVPSDQREVFPRINENKDHRIAWLGKFLQHPPEPLRRLVVSIRKTTGIDLRKLGLFIRRINSKNTERGELSPVLRAELQNVLRHDINKLSSLLQRDLSHWLS